MTGAIASGAPMASARMIARLGCAQAYGTLASADRLTPFPRGAGFLRRAFPDAPETGS